MSKKATVPAGDDANSIELCMEFLGLQAALRAVDGAGGIPDELMTKLHGRKWDLIPAITATRSATR
jgi:hypothetical protein